MALSGEAETLLQFVHPRPRPVRFPGLRRPQVQGHLAHENPLPRGTLQELYA